MKSLAAFVFFMAFFYGAFCVLEQGIKSVEKYQQAQAKAMDIKL